MYPSEAYSNATPAARRRLLASGANTHSALHGQAVRHSAQPHDEKFLRPASCSRQTQKGRHRSMHAQNGDHLNAMVRDNLEWRMM